MNETEKEVRYGTGQKWAFGSGNFATWFINSAFNLWVFTFYFSAVKLNVTYIMFAFIIWTIWNAINDPLLGYISDRTHTRWGRRTPYFVIGLVPVLILEIIIWMPPTGDQFLTFIYLLIMLICYDTFYTMIALNQDSLFPELYTSVDERSRVNTIKQITASIGLIGSALIPGIFIGDIDVMDGYLLNGIVTTILVAITMVIFIIWGAKEREEFKLDHKQEFSYLQGLRYTFKNKGFVLYTAMFFLYEYILLLLGNIVPLFGTYVLGASGTFEISVLMGLLYIVSIVTVFVWRLIDVKIGSKKGYAIAIVAYFIASIPMLWVSNYYLSIIVVVIMGFGFGGMLYFIYLLIADVIDEDELKTGIRREGSFFGITNFFMRLSMILSIVTISLVFTQTGWEEWTPNPGVDVIMGLRILFVVFPGIALGATMVCLYFYPFPKKRVQEIKKQLTELHEEKLDRVRSELK